MMALNRARSNLTDPGWASWPVDLRDALVRAPNARNVRDLLKPLRSLSDSNSTSRVPTHDWESPSRVSTMSISRTSKGGLGRVAHTGRNHERERRDERDDPSQPVDGLRAECLDEWSDDDEAEHVGAQSGGGLRREDAPPDGIRCAALDQ